ncbi:MAG: hypothetical protein E6Q27_01105 [Aeromicrobium sp.]|nr:MAG: hypothetical protein E6Q27_01105 [Aeromicrobium sp.]
MSSRTALIGAVVSSLFALGACVSIPVDGPVTKARSDVGARQSATRFVPAGPVAGATKVDVVRGYMEAMLAYPVAWTTAQEFLTPSAQQRWDPDAATLVYSGFTVESEPASNTYWVRVDRVSRLDSLGRFAAVSGSERIELSLVNIDGEWRIDSPPQGALLSQDFYLSHVQPFEVTFFNEAGTRFVAEPVHAVTGEKLATSLIKILARGPRPQDDPWQRTFLTSSLTRAGVVPLVGGVAHVTVDSRAGSGSQEDQDKASAQIISTLLRVPGITGVVISDADGVKVDTTDPNQSPELWEKFEVGNNRSWTHAIAGDRIWRIDSTAPRPAPGYLSKSAGGATNVSLSRNVSAATWKSRGVKADINGDNAVSIQGQRFLPPVVDAADAAWFIDRLNGDSRLRVVDARVTTIELEGIDRVRAFDLSADGSRVVFVDQSGRVFIAQVIREAERVVRLGKITRLGNVDGKVSHAQWLTNSTILYIRGDTPRQLREARIDGSSSVSSWSALGRWMPDVKVKRLAISPSSDPVVTILDSQQRVWVWESGTWLLVSINKAHGLS